ncbi:hypothetical protein [Burkholderia sp. BCC0405]|uniref:hypothetical protein n=1 Tax=Burkholderia sp. BCC0405 TaxID=2676298 RepID=UPI00158B27D6|nr:hypothetical protein [Burkholderia sp. BCC0405]
MNHIKNGGPAFPSTTKTYIADDGDTMHQGANGMSLRDYFAAHAPDVPDDFGWADGETDTWQRRARWSYCYADAMLRAREN